MTTKADDWPVANDGDECGGGGGGDKRCGRRLKLTQSRWVRDGVPSPAAEVLEATGCFGAEHRSDRAERTN